MDQNKYERDPSRLGKHAIKALLNDLFNAYNQPPELPTQRKPRLVLTRALVTYGLIVALLFCGLTGVAIHAELTHQTQTVANTASKPTTIAQTLQKPTPPTVQQPTPPTPVSSPNPKSNPVPSTPPPPPASLPDVPGKDANYRLGVLVIKYFPIASDGQHIDINVTGDVGDLYSTVRQHTIDVTNNLLVFLPRATRYLGSKYPGNPTSLNYYIVDTKEHDEAVPIKAHDNRVTYPNYNYVMSRENICNYVDHQNVHEVWFWAYQGPNQPSKNNQPYLGIDETKMSSKYGDVSNSYEYNDMPICQHTYTVYTFNYQRGTAEAMHSWGHQLEAEYKSVDSNLFGLFQGPDYPQALGVTGRCGWVHNPPNAREDYDYANSKPQSSDCEDWNPDGLGATTQISCAVWGCADYSDSDNAQLNYFVWMWQHLPGMNNTKTYQGKQLRNWWDVHGNYDAVVSGSKRLSL